jgi:holo-[acyl-carrier protein] synthase
MDIVGLGTEIVECARVRAMIDEHGERFLNRIYTPDELRWCQSRTNATEHYAALWAAKEAVLKALGVAGRAGSLWGQIEVEYKNDALRAKIRGALRERMDDAGIGNILLSAAYARHYATATAVAIRGEPK